MKRSRVCVSICSCVPACTSLICWERSWPAASSLHARASSGAAAKVLLTGATLIPRRCSSLINVAVSTSIGSCGATLLAFAKCDFSIYCTIAWQSSLMPWHSKRCAERLLLNIAARPSICDRMLGSKTTPRADGPHASMTAPRGCVASLSQPRGVAATFTTTHFVSIPLPRRNPFYYFSTQRTRSNAHRTHGMARHRMAQHEVRNHTSRRLRLAWVGVHARSGMRERLESVPAACDSCMWTFIRCDDGVWDVPLAVVFQHCQITCHLFQLLDRDIFSARLVRTPCVDHSFDADCDPSSSWHLLIIAWRLYTAFSSPSIPSMSSNAIHRALLWGGD